MNTPEKITAAEPINAAHEVLMKAVDAMCTQQIAAEIHGRPRRPTKPQVKAVEKWLKEVHDRGMLTSQPGRGGVALYSLTTPVCDLVQTRGESQTAAPAERVLTPEAEAEREAFEAKYGALGNCSCHISPPCGSCMHPGNPRNQEEDETAWMAAGDSEGGETDAPAWASDPALQYLAPEDYKMPPADPALLASANRALGEQLEAVKAELEIERGRLAACGVVAMCDTPESAKKARDMREEYRSASCDDVARRVDECMALRTERDDLRARLDAVTQQSIADTDVLTAQIDRLKAEIATERHAREALQEQAGDEAVDVKDAAVGYLVRVPKRAPLLRRKPESARAAALSAVRAGAARAEVLAVVPVGTARRGAEWRSK